MSRFQKVATAMLLALLTTVGSPARAEERPAPAVDLGAAWVGFADDGIASEPAFAGAFRWYVSPRLAVGPEVLYTHGDHHSHLALTGNVTWDLLSEGRRPRVIPFVVVGAGLFQTHETFFDDAVTSSEGAFTAGGGIRMRIGDRFGAGVDARVGWETHMRIGGFAAIRLGRHAR